MVNKDWRVGSQQYLMTKLSFDHITTNINKNSQNPRMYSILRLFYGK